MCFICKLSFGNTKSFGLHANTEHALNLQENEKNLLNREYSSAIIQRTDNKEPEISFLQPLGLTYEYNFPHTSISSKQQNFFVHEIDSFSIYRQQQVSQSKSILTNDTDELSAQHLHQSTDLTDNEKQRRNNLSDSTELSSSVESLNEDQQKSLQVRLLTYFSRLYHLISVQFYLNRRYVNIKRGSAKDFSYCFDSILFILCLLILIFVQLTSSPLITSHPQSRQPIDESPLKS